jgi:hypothetical protein
VWIDKQAKESDCGLIADAVLAAFWENLGKARVYIVNVAGGRDEILNLYFPNMKQERHTSGRDAFVNPLTPELNPPAQTLPDEIFYWGFCFLNRAFC